MYPKLLLVLSGETILLEACLWVQVRNLLLAATKFLISSVQHLIFVSASQMAENKLYVLEQERVKSFTALSLSYWLYFQMLNSIVLQVGTHKNLQGGSHFPLLPCFFFPVLQRPCSLFSSPTSVSPSHLTDKPPHDSLYLEKLWGSCAVMAAGSLCSVSCL